MVPQGLSFGRVICSHVVCDGARSVICSHVACDGARSDVVRSVIIVQGVQM